jgi:cell wall-associated NlpC family hydrolase
MATILNADCMNVYSQLKPVILQKPIAILHSVNSGIPALILGGGSSLITDTGQINVKYPWLTFKNKTSIKSQSSRSSLIKNSLKYLNAPYLWGGRTIFGIDCSGLTQIIYKMAGYKLPRDAHQQAMIGRTIGKVEDSMSGDLSFFGNPDGHITHTGMILENSQIIHSSGKVRIDKIDNRGIFNANDKIYSHELLMIKRIIDLNHL